jgi:hypothetical protein
MQVNSLIGTPIRLRKLGFWARDRDLSIRDRMTNLAEPEGAENWK